MRHPLYVGWFFAFWCTPTMTVTHLLFAVMTTAYILVAIQLEERDLMRAHPEYAAYRRNVPMLGPAWRRRVRISSGVRPVTVPMIATRLLAAAFTRGDFFFIGPSSGSS